MAESADLGEMAARAAVAMSLHGIEERVAALEAAIIAQPYLSSPPFLTAPDQVKFAEQFAEASKRPPRILPSMPTLTPDQIRALLRECVTVVKPGETLVIRDRNWNPEQVREIQQWMDVEHEIGRISFKVLVVIAEELAVAEPGGIPGAA